MKTLADLKRAMKLGSRWKTTHAYGFFSKNKIREIVEVKTSKVGFFTERDDGKTVVSWFEFPKSTELTFNENIVEIRPVWWKEKGHRDPFMTYELVN